VFQHVMWATDGSEAADQALSLATTLTKEGGGELLVVHCEEIALWGDSAVSVHANEDELKAKVQEQVARLSNEGVAARLEMTRAGVGGAAHAIADVAAKLGSDVIVVGTRGHTPIGGLMLGSVTQRLLHIAPCPVLAVPTRAAQATS
jgi:nucleotide-binding universal stress UspA family protein